MPLYALGDRHPSLPAAGTYWIAPDATVIGDVRLGADASIWFGSVIRADGDAIVIGESTNVQDNCVLHADPQFPVTIGDRCTLGHNARVHGCTIGDDTLVGLGSTIMNGARIGRHCLIAAGALVSEHVVIPDNSLVRGFPGRVVGAVDEAHLRLIATAAENYRRAWRRFASDLAPYVP